VVAPAAEVNTPAEHSGPDGGSRGPLGAWRRGIREVGLALITLGVIVLLFVAYQLWGTGIAEAHSQASLKREFTATVAAATTSRTGQGATDTTIADTPTVGAATSPSRATGGAIDHLVIPKIHLDAFVVEGVAETDLQRGPGHYPQTVLPGQQGNAAIAGHRTTFGAPFFSVNELAVGDKISITDTSDRTFVYTVSEPPQVVSPDDVAVLDPTPVAQLTLTTCNPRFSATSRLIIVARLTSPALPATTPVTTPAASSAPAPPAAASAAPVAAVDTLGRGNGNAWPPAIAYGAVLALLWVGVRLLINRTRRWTRAGAYVGGIVVCLAPLWFCFENVVRLLPPNI
jgi:sortase A